MIRLSPAEFQARASALRLLILDVDGVLTDGRIVLDGGDSDVKAFHAQDGLGITLARAAGLQVAFLTGRSSRAVERRARELGVEHLLQGRPDKGQALSELCAAANVGAAACAAMGDDWIDLPMLIRVGLAACPADARPELHERCHFVAGRKGGRGAVRDFVDELLRARGQQAELLERYLNDRGPAASASPARQ
jgi:3-deoxy-D-manno-octulosonate 8-phosphate phosphatase (KDO 8-P phosphatase)